MGLINSQVALEAYEHAKKRLEELEAKKYLLLKDGFEMPGLDAMIDKKREEMRACAYYAFGNDIPNDS